MNQVFSILLVDNVSAAVSEMRLNVDSAPSPLSAAGSSGSILDVTGRAGQSVTFYCSGWKTWEKNEKYFCRSPCTEKESKRLQTPVGETRRNGSISISNRGNGLLVKMSKLKIKDAGKYLCGVDRILKDGLIQVNLEVLEGELIYFTICGSFKSGGFKSFFSKKPEAPLKPPSFLPSFLVENSNLAFKTTTVLPPFVSPSLLSEVSPTTDGVSQFHHVTQSVTNTRMRTEGENQSGENVDQHTN